MNSSSWSNFHISAKNIFFGHLSELPLSSTHNLMFWSRNKGKKYTPVNTRMGFETTHGNVSVQKLPQIST